MASTRCRSGSRGARLRQFTPPTSPDRAGAGPFFEGLAATEKRLVVVPAAGHALFLERQRSRRYEAVPAHLAPGNVPLTA